MKKMTSFAVVLAAMAAVSCSKKDTPVTPITGVGFSKTVDTINLNTALDSTVFTINFDASVTRQELQNRFKLKMSSDSAVAGKDYSISAVITENPVQAKVTVKALPSLARTNFHIDISLDESMQITGNTQKLALVIRPFSPAATWFQSTAYYAPNFYYYTDSTSKWTSIPGHYAVLDENDAAVIGFVNNYVQGSGVGFFNMHRIYGAEVGIINIRTAKISVPRALELIPDAAGARKGTVRVIPQQVNVTRRDSTVFQIGISGTGAYDLDTKAMDIEMNFDDTKINGAAVNKYKYKMSVDKLTL
ncbi:hypothetical protein HNQ91_000819 [Filimonas zeae]|uniref:Uncharacterized protein n=1 Tax=Filimonas zeae TaxID=1737353 RepID=A0A917ISD2_9BACT|nr:hypothetical protein [Filimonas zeae]MDR6337797.1 hypothetical protein [Filimonas zeae]GGH60309.1 hypothetical protein GCM10011379_08020 [Filimonas zeae]